MEINFEKLVLQMAHRTDSRRGKYRNPRVKQPLYSYVQFHSQNLVCVELNYICLIRFNCRRVMYHFVVSLNTSGAHLKRPWFRFHMRRPHGRQTFNSLSQSESESESRYG
jgi:hypothetical protein